MKRKQESNEARVELWCYGEEAGPFPGAYAKISKEMRSFLKYASHFRKFFKICNNMQRFAQKFPGIHQNLLKLARILSAKFAQIWVYVEVFSLQMP